MCVNADAFPLSNNGDPTMAKNTARVEDAYTTAHVRALTLLEDLHQIVEDMPAPDTDHPINWEHVGSLQHLCERLKELKDFVAPAGE
jgi:hypothetical protein